MNVFVGVVLLAFTVQLNAFPFTYKKHETKGVFSMRNIPLLAKEVRELVNKINVGKRHQLFVRHSQECDTIYAALQEYVDAALAAGVPDEVVALEMQTTLPDGYATSASDEEQRRASCFWADFTTEKMMEVVADRHNIHIQSEAEKMWRAKGTEVLMTLEMLEGNLPEIEGNPQIPQYQQNLYMKTVGMLRAFRETGLFEVPT